MPSKVTRVYQIISKKTISGYGRIEKKLDLALLTVLIDTRPQFDWNNNEADHNALLCILLETRP